MSPPGHSLPWKAQRQCKGRRHEAPGDSQDVKGSTPRSTAGRIHDRHWRVKVMASIERRQIHGQERFLVRYRDPSGKQKARTFVSEKAAVDYEAEVRTDMRRGAYLDPQAGQMKVAPWSEKWIAAQGHLKPSTRTRYRGLLKVQILPKWGGCS